MFATGEPSLIGDVKQFSPMSKAKGDGEFIDIFGQQRGLSILDRVDVVDSFDLIMTLNHRCQATVAEYPRDRFYQDKMSVVHRRSLATTLFHRWVHTFPHPPGLCDTIFLDVKDSQETKIGTSFVNTSNVNIVRELIAQVLRANCVQNMVNFLRQQQDPAVRIRRVQSLPLLGIRSRSSSIRLSFAPCQSPNALIILSLSERSMIRRATKRTSSPLTLCEPPRPVS